MPKGATLVLGGGGLWIKAYENVGKKILNFAQNRNWAKIIILPVSINDCQDMLDLMDERFTVFCREEKSYHYCIKHNQKAEFKLADDMAFLTEAQRTCTLEEFKTRLGTLPLATFAMKAASLYHYYSIKEKRLREGVLKNLYTNRKGAVIARLFREDGESAYSPQLTNNYDISPSFVSHYPSPALSQICTHILASALDACDVVITDRLHVSITAAFLGKQVFMLDNSYGKLSGVYKRSMSGFPLVTLLPCTEAIENVDLETFEPISKKKRQFLDHGISPEEFLVSFIAREHPQNLQTFSDPRFLRLLHVSFAGYS